MNTYSPEEVDKVAEELYLHSKAHRFDNLTKDGKPQSPYNVTTGWKDIHDCSKHHYRTIAVWHLNILRGNPNPKTW